MLSSMVLGSKLQHPAVVTIVRVKYEISDSAMVVLQALRRELGSLWWGIGLRQSEPFHIIGQGHLLSHRSAEAFPTNATQLARSSILCFTNLLFSQCDRHLSPPHFLSSLLLSDYVSSALSIQSNSQPHLSFLSSAALHLPPSLFIFSVRRFFSYWLRIAEVCDRPLHTTLEK